jgi:hypothetical protein|tara:strand:+ start:1183 stop:1422 length:240 start_codon:yes stop_codon:yes gene_type:complete
MTPADQTQAFVDALTDTIQRFYDEFDLTYPQMLGALELVKADMVAEAGEYITAAALKEALEEQEYENEDEDEGDLPKDE